jgi:hypothetical protein
VLAQADPLSLPDIIEVKQSVPVRHAHEHGLSAASNSRLPVPLSAVFILHMTVIGKIIFFHQFLFGVLSMA